MLKEFSDTYDIVIVGAGPSGCSVAQHLSRDYKVLLLERKSGVRNKPCGGILAEEAQELLSKMHPPPSIFSNPKYLSLRYVDWDNSFQKDEERKLWNVKRSNLDLWLSSMCEGVDFSAGSTLVNLRTAKQGFELLIEKNGLSSLVQCRYLIGANGSSTNLRSIINSEKKIRRYLAIQEWIKSNVRIGHFVYFIYDNSITDFYCWVIPKNGHLIVGSALQSERAKIKFDLFKSKLAEKLCVNGEILKKEVHLIFRPFSIKDIFLGTGNMMLVGEASGFVSPSTGEGIGFALRSGHYCADALNMNCKNASERYRDYCKVLLDEIKEKIRKARNLSNPEVRSQILRR